jgi:hypothetical protein
MTRLFYYCFSPYLLNCFRISQPELNPPLDVNLCACSALPGHALLTTVAVPDAWSRRQLSAFVCFLLTPCFLSLALGAAAHHLARGGWSSGS